MKNNALVVIAHGSRKETSNEEVRVLTKKVEKQVAGKYKIAKAAFLEFAQPSIEETIAECTAEGAESITILPYFLASGHHVSMDIPMIIEKMRDAYPDVCFTIKEHIGSAEGMVFLLSHMS